MCVCAQLSYTVGLQHRTVQIIFPLIIPTTESTFVITGYKSKWQTELPYSQIRFHYLQKIGSDPNEFLIWPIIVFWFIHKHNCLSVEIIYYATPMLTNTIRSEKRQHSILAEQHCQQPSGWYDLVKVILWGHVEDISLLSKFFFRLSIRALVAKI